MGRVRGCWEFSGPQTMETVADVLGMGDWLHSDGRLSEAPTWPSVHNSWGEHPLALCEGL